MTRGNVGKKLPEPPLTEPSALASYAEEHLTYEVRMFYTAVSQLLGIRRRQIANDATTTATPSLLEGATVESWFAKMARIEAFVLHFRNLVAFLFPDEHHVKSTDVAAHHFLGGPDSLEAWVKARGAFSDSLRTARTRAHKELAHVTTERKPGVDRTKAWPAADLASEMATILEVFLKAAEPARLGDAAAVISTTLKKWRGSGTSRVDGGFGTPPGADAP